MAGIYVHVPFCVSRCIYCDFFSTVETERKEAYVDALCQEMQDRQQELLLSSGTQMPISTIYIGGGTPSQLSFQQMQRIFDTIGRCYPVEENAEVTIEVNPDDVDTSFIKGLSELCVKTVAETTCGVTRVSMGIQTFDDELLRFLRRRHTAAKAFEAINLLEQWSTETQGQLNIDLIFGLPGQTLDLWRKDLNILRSLPIHHLSAYSLMFEEGTPLWNLRQQGKVKEASDETSLKMFMLLKETAEKMGMEHYEISNFALPGCRSRHNSSYWTGFPYLGFGAGAHSFDGDHLRRENISSLQCYLQHQDTPYYIIEQLDKQTLYNEFVMCSLRRCEGIDLDLLQKKFGVEALHYCLKMAKKFIDGGLLLQSDKHLRFSRQGVFVSDDIMSDLMSVDMDFC